MDLHGVDLNLMVTFDALMRERSVTRTGARVGRTQPAISAALARLRHLFKDELFIRSVTGLQPTSRAIELSVPIASALAQLQQTLAFTQTFDPLQTSATFTLGVSDHPAYLVLPELLHWLGISAPGVALRVKSFSARERAIELLDAGEVNAAIGLPSSGTPRILTAPMFSERFVCIARIAHPAIPGRLTLKTFLALRHLLVSPEGDGVGHVDMRLAELGKRRNIALQLQQMYAAPAIIAASDLIATVMEGIVRSSGMQNRLQMFRTPVSLEEVPFVLLWHRRSDTHPAQRWFREQVLAVGARLQRERSGRPFDKYS